MKEINEAEEQQGMENSTISVTPLTDEKGEICKFFVRWFLKEQAS